MERLQQSEMNAKKFKEIRRRPVRLPQGEIIRTGFLTRDEGLPLVIEPAVKDVDLVDWVRGNLEHVEQNLLRYGGILFRGFDLDSVNKFHDFSQTACNQLAQFTPNSKAPEKVRNQNIRTAVTYPPDKKLRLHNELNFNHFRWPMKIMFYCIKPSDRGGETPIADCRKVYNLIDPEIRRRFEAKGILYVKNYWRELRLTWEQDFDTSDVAQMEAYCRNTFMDYEWVEEDRLRVRFVRPAVVRHPKTDELLWFCQAQLAHLSCHEPIVTRSWLSTFSQEDLPSNCYYGEGSVIEDSVMQEVLAAYDQAEVSFPWQKNDVLVLDNMMTVHGRNPFVGERQLFAAMGDVINHSVLRQLTDQKQNSQ